MAGAPSIYPFRRMKVGDSFTVPVERRKSINSLCSRYSRELSATFVTRTTEDNKSIRVYRVE